MSFPAPTKEQEELAIISFADNLIKLADKIRNKEVVIINVEYKRDFERYWNNGEWNFFPTKNTLMSLEYYDVEFKDKEIERRDLYLKSNPNAELISDLSSEI